MRRSVSSKSALFWGNPANWLALAAAGFCAWKIWGTSASAANVVFPVEKGRDYEFVIEAHPYGDFDEWYAGAQEGLESTGAHSLEMVSRSEGSVVLRFVKTPPVTTTLPMRTILYPNTPQLATATLLDAKPTSAPSGVLPLGTSA